jgi:predicted dehydrogenase
MNSTIPVAVVGTGRFGKKHLQKYAANDRATLVALVDPDPATQSLAKGYGVPWFRCVDELPPGLVRAASVSVPNALHAGVGIALLVAGVDVLMEKPLATSLADADALIHAALVARSVLQVGHIERFNPAVVAVPTPLRAGRFEASRRGPAPERDWVSDVVLDLMIHDVELIIHWSGMVPAVVTARGEAGPWSEIDQVEATLAFPDGATALLTASRGRLRRKVRIECGDRHIILDCLAQRAYDDGVVVAAFGRDDALAAEIDAFLDAVLHRTLPIVSGSAGRAALAVALCIRDHVVAARSHPVP